MAPNIIMDHGYREYYKDSLALMKPDLDKPGGYNEIYILSQHDFSGARTDPKSPGLGIPLLERGEFMTRLKKDSPAHYRLIADEMMDIARDPASLSSDSSISFSLNNMDKDNPYKVGIIFSPNLAHSWDRFGPRGVSPSAAIELRESGAQDQDDFRKYIALPHEMGHLLDAAGKNKFIYETDKSVEDLKKAREAAGPEPRRQGEIDADIYAKGIFEEATKRGLTANPYVLDRHLNFRTLTGVDQAINGFGPADIHMTTPFMKGGDFEQTGHADYARGVRKLNGGIDVSLAKTLGEQVVRHNQGGAGAPETLWDRSIQDCFKTASDDSYASWKAVNNTVVGFQKKMNVKNPLDMPPLLDFSGSFRSCMQGDFSNRYKLLIDQYGNTEPGSTEEKIIGMYDVAATMELAEEDTTDPATVPDTAPHKAPPALRR